MNSSEYKIYIHPEMSEKKVILKGPGGLTTFTAVYFSQEGNETIVLTYYRELIDEPEWMDVVMIHRSPIEDFWTVPKDS